MNTLILAHVDGDCGNYTTGNTFDLLEVRCNDIKIATVKLSYEGKNGFALFCSEIDNKNSPKCFSEVHLIACVTSTIMRAFTADHEFYCDVFYDFEKCEAVELSLFDPLAA